MVFFQKVTNKQSTENTATDTMTDCLDLLVGQALENAYNPKTSATSRKAELIEHLRKVIKSDAAFKEKHPDQWTADDEKKHQKQKRRVAMADACNRSIATEASVASFIVQCESIGPCGGEAEPGEVQEFRDACDQMRRRRRWNRDRSIKMF